MAGFHPWLGNFRMLWVWPKKGGVTLVQVPSVPIHKEEGDTNISEQLKVLITVPPSPQQLFNEHSNETILEMLLNTTGVFSPP